MPATQLVFDFTAVPPPIIQIIQDSGWHEVTELARGAGFNGPCEISDWMQEHLDDQTLYDALWTACFTLSLNQTGSATFTIEVRGKPVRFKAFTTSHAVQLGRVEDF